MDSKIIRNKDYKLDNESLEGSEDNVVVAGEAPIIEKKKSSLSIRSSSEDGKIKTVGPGKHNIFLRPFPSLSALSIDNFKKEIEIFINKPMTLDFILPVKNTKRAKINIAELNYANHNVFWDITYLLNDLDGSYAELLPEQLIDLSFDIERGSHNTKYFLKSVGRYETDSSYVEKMNKISNAQLAIEPITEYKLFENYPNPFNPSTTIRYQIPENGMVTLKVYDILGREVKTLVNDFKTKGRYEVTFDAGSLASGLYIYEIKSGDYKASKKMTLIK